jgi:hypothetical protein
VGLVKEASEHGAMMELMNLYPIFPRIKYLLKIMKAIPLYFLTNHQIPSWFFLYLCSTLGIQHKDSFVSLVRGFPKMELVRNIRQRPPVALLAVLERALNAFDPGEFRRFSQRAEAASEALRRGGLVVPGSAAAHRHYWLYPVVVANRDAAEDALNSCGIDVSKSSTQLKCVEPPAPEDLAPGQMSPDLSETRAMIDNTIYLPINKTVSERQLQRIVDCVIAFEGTGKGLPSSL